MNKTVFSIVSLFLLVAACVASGYFMGKTNQVSPESTQTAQNQLSPELSKLVLKADTAAGGKKIAMATASIDGDIDVVFTLDFESGNLFAWLPGPTGTYLGEWSVNVAKAVGLEKGSNPDLVMTVGDFNVRTGNSGGLRDVPLICYIANGDNGQVAGFVFQWNPQLAKNGTFQRGAMVAGFPGSTRQQTIKRQ